MTTAAAAAEYRSNLGHDFTMADALDPEYLDAEPDVEERAASHEAEHMATLRGSQTYGLPRVGAFLI
jgi:hypothetical protein